MDVNKTSLKQNYLKIVLSTIHINSKHHTSKMSNVLFETRRR